ARIRRRWRTGTLTVGVIGEKVDLTYPYEYLGAGAQTLKDLAEGRHSFAETLKAAQKPLVIVGTGAAARRDGAAILALAARIALDVGKGDGADAFNLLHTAASRVAGLDLGFVPKDGKLLDAAALDVVYLLGADEIPAEKLGKAFVIYQGSHGDAGASRADVVLPGSAYTEKSGTYVNLEGRAQQTGKAAFAPGEAREDWAILRALSAKLGKTLPYDTLSALRAEMYKAAPGLAALEAVTPAAKSGLEGLAKAAQGSLDAEPFRSPVADFYLTNPIARASAIMAELSALKKNMKQGTTGTHG
ncbi:MAG: NADH-quinone oxidoreductase subunit G, partial [Hyphomicrobiales bacterium]